MIKLIRHAHIPLQTFRDNNSSGRGWKLSSILTKSSTTVQSNSHRMWRQHWQLGDILSQQPRHQGPMAFKFSAPTATEATIALRLADSLEVVVIEEATISKVEDIINIREV